MVPDIFAVNFFIALFALIDPVGNVPLFAAATRGVKNSTARLIAVFVALFVMGFLIFFFFTGLSLLAFFGISLPAFRIAGGILLLLLGLDMTRNDFAESMATGPDEPQEGGRTAQARKRFESMIVPFAMPLLIGPGAISTVIIYASEARDYGVAGVATGVGVIVLVAISTMLSFWATPLISRLLGRIGLAIVVRVLGLILCAMAVQFILSGIADSTTGLILEEASQPYKS
ncbi:MAG: MarC family protein [Phenylobacterium sp.]|uniref:MarC family protein n=1 Tax=Phenylobacterium sp. TaxID=1871053 RepID=UPI0025CEBFB8|nr:MarC family protein [Phenylobacterium sp.]MCA3708574.1 MarC family protein [Phenylobacterium sp.]MCA3724776.1 MarC family protein [Phenylobacterium sp.]MCA3725520.1 MarC family protein [Phenylobacterium sp.]MCA3736256.1 MarC family protein [Phenylobacterium sp.]MCA3736870.1 MarC family protein [Phenylobacterium sp.]